MRYRQGLRALLGEPLITHLAEVSVIKCNTDLIKGQTYKPKAQNLTNGGRRHASDTLGTYFVRSNSQTRRTPTRSRLASAA